jgi:hypothetical protein
MNSFLKVALLLVLGGCLNQSEALVVGGGWRRQGLPQPMQLGRNIGESRNGGVVDQCRLMPLMMADSIDQAMFGCDDGGSITEVDGVKTVQYTAEETLAISEGRFYIRKYMGNVLRALVSHTGSRLFDCILILVS